MVTVFRSTDIVGKDILGVTSTETGTVKLWDPDKGIFEQYTLKNNFTYVSLKGSHYGDSYSLIYGFNKAGSWTGPIYITNLANYDSQIGTDAYRLKWSKYAPSILTNNYLVASSAYGYKDGVIMAYSVELQAPTTTTTTTTTTSTTTTTTTESTSTTTTQQTTTTTQETGTTTSGETTTQTNQETTNKTEVQLTSTTTTDHGGLPISTILIIIVLAILASGGIIFYLLKRS